MKILDISFQRDLCSDLEKSILSDNETAHIMPYFTLNVYVALRFQLYFFPAKNISSLSDHERSTGPVSTPQTCGP